MHSITHNKRTIEFELLRKPRLKNTYIQITANGVIVKTNRSTSIKEIKALVTKKFAWIVKHSETFKAKKVDKALVTGSELYYLGKPYVVEIKENEALKRVKVEFVDFKFVIEAQKEVPQEELDFAVNEFYKARAKEQIEPLVAKWSKEMKLEPSYVGYRKAKTRWGSCSSVDRISFNYYLAKLPSELIEYVVVHELAHIEHKNHSASFWALLKKYLDDYKLKEEKIREFERLF